MLAAICNRLDTIDERKIESDNRDGRGGNLRDRDTSSFKNKFEASSDPVIEVGNNMIVQAKLPRGGWLKNPFEELKFTGRNDAQIPKDFFVSSIARYEDVDERDQLYYFGRSMKGAAANWYSRSGGHKLGESHVRRRFLGRGTTSAIPRGNIQRKV